MNLPTFARSKHFRSFVATGKFAFSTIGRGLDGDAQNRDNPMFNSRHRSGQISQSSQPPVPFASRVPVNKVQLDTALSIFCEADLAERRAIGRHRPDRSYAILPVNDPAPVFYAGDCSVFLRPLKESNMSAWRHVLGTGEGWQFAIGIGARLSGKIRPHIGTPFNAR
jgi:hypothetical protein